MFEVVCLGRDKGCWLIATWPIGLAEVSPKGHVPSRPCPLHTSTTYPGSRASKTSWRTRQVHAHSVPPRRHAAAVVRALRAILDVVRGGKGRNSREWQSWENSPRPIATHNSPYGKGYTTSAVPFPLTGTISWSYSVFHISIIQHSTCKA